MPYLHYAGKDHHGVKFPAESKKHRRGNPPPDSFVDFPESIPEAERDYDLDKKLQAEYPAILQWMVDGCLEWQRIGLCKPEAVKKQPERISIVRIR
jgi:Predicted ATPase